MTDNSIIVELADAQTRQRNAAIAKFKKHCQDIGLQKTAPYYGRQIPPRLNPFYPGWIPLLAAGYEMLTAGIVQFNDQLILSSRNKIDPVAYQELMRHFDEFRSAVADAAAVINEWTPTEEAEDPIPPLVDRIADYGKHVYAVGSRDISWMQHRLEQLAYTGRIDIEEQNELHHDVCYDLGEPLYQATTSLLHDHATWDGGWDWDENTYSDGRPVMIRAQIPDWQELFDEVPINYAIKVYGDGVINEFPKGVVCFSNPPVNPNDSWYPDVEISLQDLRRQPWINTRWGAKTAAEWNQAEDEERARRHARWKAECWQENAHHLEAEKFREEEVF